MLCAAMLLLLGCFQACPLKLLPAYPCPSAYPHIPVLCCLQDVVVYEETDERFYVGISKTRSEVG